jgi:hypothetical protein
MKGELGAPGQRKRKRKRKHKADLPAEAQARRNAIKNGVVSVSFGWIQPAEFCARRKTISYHVDSFSSVNPHLSLASGRSGHPPTGRANSVRRLSSIPACRESKRGTEFHSAETHRTLTQ